MTENEISYLIRGAIYNVYNKLGPGILESTYVQALIYELKELNLKVKSQVAQPMKYEGCYLEIGYRMDLLVEDNVVVEIKSVENISAVHHKQLLTYLRLSNLKLGILVNFNSANIDKSIYRKVNGL